MKKKIKVLDTVPHIDGFKEWIQEWEAKLNTLRGLRQMYQELPESQQTQVKEALRQYQQSGSQG